METTTCLFCASVNEEPLVRRESPRHVVCKECGLVFQNPRPTTEEMQAFYQQGYWEGRAVEAPEKSNRVSMARADAIVGWTKDHVSSEDLVVEIGCGRGDILAQVRKALPCRPLGVEPSQMEAESAQRRHGFEVQCAGLEGADLRGQPARLLILSHVLEHFHDPRAAVARCAALLHDNGLLFVEVPNILHPSPIKGYALWLAVEHMYYFSMQSLQRLLREQGFEILQETDDVFVRVLARKSSAKAPAATYPNEYRQVWRAYWRHELKYWPWRLRQKITRAVRGKRPAATSAS